MLGTGKLISEAKKHADTAAAKSIENPSTFEGAEESIGNHSSFKKSNLKKAFIFAALAFLAAIISQVLSGWNIS